MQKVIDGNLVNYQIFGKGNKNLLILPGWLASLKEWLPTAEELVEKYRVILLDFPGFGESSRPKEDWGIYEYANFVEKFLKELGVEKATILGHSFGGRVGIVLASRTNLVEKLVLIDAAGMEIKNLFVKLKLFTVGILRPFYPLLPENLKKVFRSEDYKRSGVMAEIFKKVVSQPLREELKNIRVPTLIVWGDKDWVEPLAEAKMLMRGIVNSRLRIVWGASHWPHLERTEEFFEILKEENV